MWKLIIDQLPPRYLLSMQVRWILGIGCALLSSCQTTSHRPPKQLIPASGSVYKKCGDVELRLIPFYPEGHRASDARPAAVLFFGGGWNGGKLDQFEPQARYLASRGMVGILADYRVKSRHATTPFACVADGKSAVRWVRKNADRLGVDPNRIAAGGGSAGGHVAATTGVISGLEEPGEDTSTSSSANALLLFNPVIDNGPGGWGHSRVKDRYLEISPLHNISPGAPPTILFLGRNDRLIPAATVQKYRDQMQAVGSRCDLHLYDGQGHGFFNQSRNAQHFYLTVFEMDCFLSSLGWLHGKPTIVKPKTPR